MYIMPPKKDKKKKAKKPTVTQRQTVIVNVGDRRRKAARKPRAKKPAMGGDFGIGGVTVVPSNIIRMNAPPQPFPLQPTLPMIEPVKNVGDYSLLENRLQGVIGDVGRITGVVEDAIRQQQQQRQLQQLTQATITELKEEVKRGRPPLSEEEKARRAQVKSQEKARERAELREMRGADKPMKPTLSRLKTF